MLTLPLLLTMSNHKINHHNMIVYIDCLTSFSLGTEEIKSVQPYHI